MTFSCQWRHARESFPCYTKELSQSKYEGLKGHATKNEANGQLGPERSWHLALTDLIVSHYRAKQNKYNPGNTKKQMPDRKDIWERANGADKPKQSWHLAWVIAVVRERNVVQDIIKGKKTGKTKTRKNKTRQNTPTKYNRRRWYQDNASVMTWYTLRLSPMPIFPSLMPVPLSLRVPFRWW